MHFLLKTIKFSSNNPPPLHPKQAVFIQNLRDASRSSGSLGTLRKASWVKLHHGVDWEDAKGGEASSGILSVSMKPFFSLAA